jgi:glycosyltransferase involved in cell wall biosynthesis
MLLIGDRLELVSTGSLQPYKGQKYLIEACAQLHNLGIPFRCRIIGEGDERPSLEQLITTLGLQGKVQLLGAQTQDEVAKLLATAHCYVQPSIITPAGKMEGIPVSIMEAFACGLPVVATELSGVPELVRPDETGYLVPPADARALTKALAHIFHHQAEANELAQNGRRLVLAEFEIEDNARRLSQLFEQFTNQPITSAPLSTTDTKSISNVNNEAIA